MFHTLMTVYVIILFVLLTPGVLVHLPAHSSRLTSAVVHGLIFAVIFHYTHKFVWNMFYGNKMQVQKKQ